MPGRRFQHDTLALSLGIGVSCGAIFLVLIVGHHLGGSVAGSERLFSQTAFSDASGWESELHLEDLDDIADKIRQRVVQLDLRTRTE